MKSSGSPFHPPARAARRDSRRSRQAALALACLVPLAAGAQEAKLPAPDDYPAAGPGCRSRQRLETKYTSSFVAFPSTIECQLLIHAVCGGELQQFSSGARTNRTGVCDDFAKRADDLRGREVCCDAAEDSPPAPTPQAGAAAQPACSAAEPGGCRLEPGRWSLRLASSTNGVPEPTQEKEACLQAAELADVGSYFAPALEGAEADCTTTHEKSDDPRRMSSRTQCTGAGFRVEVTTHSTIEDSHGFGVAVRSDAHSAGETALVLADIVGRWRGPCDDAPSPP